MINTSALAVRVVSDGSFLLDGGPVFGQVPKTLWEQNAKPDRKNRVRLGLNSLLIKTLVFIYQYITRRRKPIYSMIH